MRKFCVAYISFHDNNLVQSIVEADSEFHALQSAYPDVCIEATCVSDAQSDAFNQDSMVSVIEVD